MSRTILIAGSLLLAAMCAAQQPTNQQAPPVKVNVLNVCTPSPDEQQGIAAALAAIPKRPSFSPDFEVDRGRSVLDPNSNPLMAAGAPHAAAETAVADFVRMRHDIGGSSQYSTVQYSFSRDTKQMVETLVFRVRDPKELLQVSLEDSASSVTPPSVMLTAATPVSRIKLERFGKPSVVLARCSSMETGQPVDQSKYEPLFSSATAALSSYRDLLNARTLVPEELTRLGHARTKPAAKATESKPSKH
ncbi:MAG TPA: hypothetical protein VFM77_10750 [Terriglobales bacterium]|nr:hypothetical protein [Terriglobales bacterium]